MGNIEKLAAAGLKEKSRLAKKGREAVAVVVAMKKEIQTSFYAMGKALVVLRDPAVIRALGHASFEQLCEVDLKMSDAQATRLIHIVESFPKGVAGELGSTKATAVIDLANALGKKTTAGGLVKRGTVHLPNGASIDVKSASAAKIARAAKAIHSRSVKGPGMHVSPEDRRIVAHVAAALRRAKLEATVEALAAGKKDGARMRLTLKARDAVRVGRALARSAS